MTIWQAIVMGIVQGLTEFLPVSSTAHLRITPAVVGFADPGPAFTAIIQLGTLAAVIGYFFKDIRKILGEWTVGLFTGKPLATHGARLGWWIILATVPIVVCGLLFKSWIKGPLRSLEFVAVQLLIGSLLMSVAEWVAKRRTTSTKGVEQLGAFEVIGTGFFQALALCPGMSRSGSTISGGLLLGMSREAATRFSFLLSLPAISAAGIYSLWDDVVKPWREGSVGIIQSQADFWNLAISTVVSGLVGYAAIDFLLRYLRTRTMASFIVYRVILVVVLFYCQRQGWLI